MRQSVQLASVMLAAFVLACSDGVVEPDDTRDGPPPIDPGAAQRAVIDRFSDAAGSLFVRSADPTLPAAGAAIDFDQAPFLTQGFGPAGQIVRYYNFDIQPTTPVPIWVLFREGSNSPVEGQLNIIDVIPGDEGYNDLWQVTRVTVPADYVANTATSIQDVLDAGFAMEQTGTIVNCPVVPEGSVASEGGGGNGLVRGWYKDQLVFYFDFNEAPLSTTQIGTVPTSPIFVTFTINPDQPGGGPASGFVHQGESVQSHNVVATIPGDEGYSPLWDVFPYDNASFDDVHDLASAQSAPTFGLAGMINCPVVFVGTTIPGNDNTAQRALIDRFSDTAGRLFQRSANSDLPAPGEAVDFDQEPFISQGFGPDGRVVRYYNFDFQPTTPAPIFVLFYENGQPVPRQHNIIDAIPGEDGYNDLWQVAKVTVPDEYVANTATSVQDVLSAGYAVEFTDTIVNCPVVPEGSVASEGSGAEGLIRGWYKGELVFYFNFNEAPITLTGAGTVPTSPIFVTFNINPDQPGGGPASGFMVEPGTVQSHNVVATLPGDVAYSPLWDVFPYDNASFAQVTDLASAQAAPSFGFATLVNCPVVFIE